MAIDMEALRIAAQGDQDDRVTVKRRWLTEVHRKMKAQAEELEQLRSASAFMNAVSGFPGYAGRA